MRPIRLAAVILMVLSLSIPTGAYSQSKPGPDGKRGTPKGGSKGDSRPADSTGEAGTKQDGKKKTAEEALADVFDDDQKVKADEKARSEKKRNDEATRKEAEATKVLVGPVLSFYIVLAEDRRNEAMDRIAKEKKYARFGGVVNRAVMYEAQQQIRRADDEIARLKALAKENKATVLPRKHKSVNRVEECLADGGDDSGAECPLVNRIARVVDYQDPGEDE